MSTDLTEIRIHGRGGQGNVLAAYLLATAAIDEEQWAQAFPAFGAERRGAPVAAFVRMSSQPHLRHCQIAEPDYVIVQDETLIQVPAVLKGLKKQGAVLINSSRPVEHFTQLNGLRAIALPATQLAMEHLHRPIPNTALLAAFLRLTGLLSTDSLVKALSHRLPPDQVEKNRTLIAAACEMVPEKRWEVAA